MKGRMVFAGTFVVITVVAVCAWLWHQRAGDSPVAPATTTSIVSPDSPLRSDAASDSLPKASPPRDRPLVQPQGRAVDVVARLRDQADQGDAEAALGIYVKLLSCKDHASQFSEQARAIYRVAGVTDETLDKSAQRLREDCQGSEQLVATRGTWLEIAVHAGSTEGMLLYAANPESILGDKPIAEMEPDQVADYAERSLAYMEELAGRGNVSAMLTLSNMYEASKFLPPDQVRSAAYQLAAESAAPLEIMTQPARYTFRGLSPSQQTEALQLARAITQQCCKGK